MASSYSSQIPGIIHLVSTLRPKRVLDIGKGFGKYAFLIHEYVGIASDKKIYNQSTMRELSQVLIDAVEVDDDLMLPHLNHLYTNVYVEDVRNIYAELGPYDLVMMIDVIEHIDKEQAIIIVKNFLKKNSVMVIASPIKFFGQSLYQSKFENHISHWARSDFETLGFVDMQRYGDGAVYLVSNSKLDVRGWGGKPIKRLRRIARAMRNEMFW